MYFGLATSLTLGLSLLASVLVLREFAGRRKRPDLAPAPRRDVGLVVAVTLTVICVHLAIASLFIEIDASRALASLIPMALLLAAGGALANAVASLSAARLHRGLVRCFVVLCLLAISSLLGAAVPSPLDWGRPIFPFSEPSHFALAFSTILLYTCVTSKERLRTLCILVGLLLVGLLQNLTLAIGCLLVALTTLRLSTLAILSMALMAILSQLDLSYYAARIDLSGEGQNLSNLVYLQGWQMIEEAWSRSHGLGIGFQQLGVTGTDVAASDLLRALLDGGELNLLDGGFVFAKLASDFGALGLLLGILYLCLAVRSFVALRGMGTDETRPRGLLVLAHCAVLAYGIELFIRGGGYFSAGSLLLMTGLWVIRKAGKSSASRVMAGSGPKPVPNSA